MSSCISNLLGMLGSFQVLLVVPEAGGADFASLAPQGGPSILCSIRSCFSIGHLVHILPLHLLRLPLLLPLLLVAVL